VSLQVEVLDPELGFVLAQRLPKGAEVVESSEGWLVTLDGPFASGALEEMLFAIRSWLRDESISETLVLLDGKEHVLEGED
jgi:hypothetical protein